MKRFWKDWGRLKLSRNKAIWREKAKKRAGLEAVKHIKDGFIVGLGSGSTSSYAIQETGKRIAQEGLRILGVPTSYQAMLLAVSCSIPLTTLNEHPQIDLTIDGADEIDKELNLIKGGGGALTREKVVASASKQLVIVTDETKIVEKLGANHPLPVEVLPFALSGVMQKINELGGKPVFRKGSGKVGPTVTDNGNFIIDAYFGPINDPEKLNLQLKLIPGVIETGLFIKMVDLIYVGKANAVQRIERN